MHDADIALDNFLRTGDITFARQLAAYKPKEINTTLSGDRLAIKIHMGLFKTEGLIITGQANVEQALTKLWQLRQFLGKHVKRPRMAGQQLTRLAQRLRATFG